MQTTLPLGPCEPLTQVTFTKLFVITQLFFDWLEFIFSGCLFIWADFSRLFKREPTDKEALSIYYKMLEHLVYIPPAKGFNGTNPKYFKILYSISKEDLIEAMRRFKEFVHVWLSMN